MVIFAADVFVDGLLAVARTLGISAFVLSVALSGFETENLAAGIAANAKGLPGAAAGTFLGGVTFLAFGVAGLGGLIAPIRVELPTRFAVWTAIAPAPAAGRARSTGTSPGSRVGSWWSGRWWRWSAWPARDARCSPRPTTTSVSGGRACGSSSDWRC